ncbi:MAG TPA: type 4 pilus major pilin [Nevskiaceae bacterium]|nr:type 4 pilus major pilin [Nevskiaceae bacterium]
MSHHIAFQHNLAHQRGQFLVLITVAIILAAGIVFFGFRKYEQGKTSSQVQQALGSFTTMAAAIEQGFQSVQGDSGGVYTGVTTQEIAEGGYVPTADVQSSNVMGPFGAALQFAPATNANYLNITYPNVPDAACHQFVNGLVNNATAVAVNGTVIYDTGASSGSAQAFDATQAAALSTDCSPSSGAPVSIQVTIGR